MNPLIAQQAQGQDATLEFLRSMRYEFNEGASSTTEIVQQVALLAAAILLFWVGVRLLGIVQEGRRDPVAREAQRLFVRLLGQLELSWSDRLWLRLIARASEHAQPAVILASPALLDAGVRRWSARVRIPGLRSVVRQRMSAVSTRLHGGPLP